MRNSVNKLLGYTTSKKHQLIQYLPENQQKYQYIKLIACREDEDIDIVVSKNDTEKLHL